MGSCLGTNSAAPPPKTPLTPNSTHHDGGSKSPPPVYEETVKEVLSETPAIPKHRLLPIPRFHETERTAAAAKKPSDYEIHSEVENDGALRQQRPFPREVKREKAAGRSPARRSDTSPGRVKPGSGNVMNTGGGERSGRRPRSPVTRSDSGTSKTGIDTGKTCNYPGRKEYGSGDRIRKGKEAEIEPPTNNELLESSLVSLECFIFL